MEPLEDIFDLLVDYDECLLIGIYSYKVCYISFNDETFEYQLLKSEKNTSETYGIFLN